MTSGGTPRSRHIAARLLLVALTAALAAVLLPGAAAAAPAGCANRTNNTYDKLLGCVTLEGVRAHQAALQAIADANDDPNYPGTRAAGTEGYANSVDYVAGLLEDAGYNVTLDPFEFEFQFPAILRQLTPAPAVNYETGSFTNSGFGGRRHRTRDSSRHHSVPPRGDRRAAAPAILARLRWRSHRSRPRCPNDFAGFAAGNRFDPARRAGDPPAGRSPSSRTRTSWPRPLTPSRASYPERGCS